MQPLICASVHQFTTALSHHLHQTLLQTRNPVDSRLTYYVFIVSICKNAVVFGALRCRPVPSICTNWHVLYHANLAGIVNTALFIAPLRVSYAYAFIIHKTRGNRLEDSGLAQLLAIFLLHRKVITSSGSLRAWGGNVAVAGSP